MPLLLGIDTGGTFTDAVLYDEAQGVVAKAKALTTHHDLAVGIGDSVASVLRQSGAEPAAVSLTSLSTTLATNAMVEGQGGRVGLVMIGFDAADTARPQLKAALGEDPVILVDGGHDAFGAERAPFDARGLRQALSPLAPRLTALAVAGRFSVLDASHETAARDLIRAETGLPVTCSHELSARLDGPRRALTALLNARLVHLIDRLITATEGRLAAAGIAAPLMVVRGDGALVTAALARARPIETIFSGPAASAVGGAFLAGTRDAVIADIGGTTTDVALLADGRPRIEPEGATIGGFRTMVEAIAIRTCGLGGDSEVAVAHRALGPAIELGPRRAIPVSLLAVDHPAVVHAALDRQLAADFPSELAGRFALRLGPTPPELPAPEAAIAVRLGDGPEPLDRLLQTRRERHALLRLVDRRAVILSAFTPTDAAHALGRFAAWDGAAAAKAASLLARQRDAMGRPFAAGADAACHAVLAALIDRSADFVLDCAFAEDGFAEAGLSRHPLVRRALEEPRGLAQLSLSFGLPLVGLGASAATYYPEIAQRLRAPSLVPDHAEVANAVGAVVGGVHVGAEVKVLQPAEGIFRILGAGVSQERQSERDAIAFASEIARSEAAAAAVAAGAAGVEVSVEVEVKRAEAEGRDIFVEARILARASGRPRMG